MDWTLLVPAIFRAEEATPSRDWSAFGDELHYGRGQMMCAVSAQIEVLHHLTITQPLPPENPKDLRTPTLSRCIR